MNSSTRGTNYAPNKTPPVTDKYRKGYDKYFGVKETWFERRDREAKEKKK